MATTFVGGSASRIFLLGVAFFAGVAVIFWALYGASFALRSDTLPGLIKMCQTLLLALACVMTFLSAGMFVCWVVDYGCRRRQAGREISLYAEMA